MNLAREPEKAERERGIAVEPLWVCPECESELPFPLIRCGACWEPSLGPEREAGGLTRALVCAAGAIGSLLLAIARLG